MEPSGSDSAARNTFYSLLVRLTGAAFTAGTTLFLLRALGPEEFGLLSLALALVTLVSFPVDLGISQSTARFVAESRGDPRASAAVLGDAIKLKLAVAGSLNLALFAAAGPIARAYGDERLTWPIRAMAIAFAAQSLMLLITYAFIAQGKIVANLRIVALESACETAATVALVLIGFGVVGAAFGRAAGYVIGAAFAIAVATRWLGRGLLSFRAPARAQVRRLAGYAGVLTIIDFAWVVLGQMNALLVGAFMGTASVGLFQAPSRLIMLLGLPGLAISEGVAPRLARSRDSEPDTGALVLAMRYLLLLEVLLIIPLVVWPGPVAGLALGSDYGDSASVLRALVPFVFLSGFAPVLSIAVNYLGEARRRVPVAVATVIVNVAVGIVLIPTIGIVGAAIAADLAFLLYVGGHFWICRSSLGFDAVPLAVSAGRAFLAGLAMAAMMLAVGTSDLSALAWVGGLALGIATYAAALVATGELTQADLSRLRVRR